MAAVVGLKEVVDKEEASEKDGWKALVEIEAEEW